MWLERRLSFARGAARGHRRDRTNFLKVKASASRCVFTAARDWRHSTLNTCHCVREDGERVYDEDTGKKKEIKKTNRGRVNIGRRAVPFPVRYQRRLITATFYFRLFLSPSFPTKPHPSPWLQQFGENTRKIKTSSSKPTSCRRACQQMSADKAATPLTSLEKAASVDFVSGCFP